MDKKFKCIMCGSLFPFMVMGTVYCFAEKYCEDCKEKLDKQPHNIENNIPPDTRQIFVTGLSGTTISVIDTSSN